MKVYVLCYITKETPEALELPGYSPELISFLYSELRPFAGFREKKIKTIS
jgi:hypothetical protein